MIKISEAEKRILAKALAKDCITLGEVYAEFSTPHYAKAKLKRLVEYLGLLKSNPNNTLTVSNRDLVVRTIQEN